MDEVNESKSISASVDEDIDQKMADVSLKSLDDVSDAASNEVFFKQVRDILNKMTPNALDTLLKDIKALNVNTVEQLNGIVSLIFEKAIFEQTYPFVYAQLCSKLSESIDSELKKFKKEMISKCQHEVENHVFAHDTVVAEKLRPLLQKVEEATDPDDKADSQTYYENEQWKLKRRSVGIVRFVGELFTIGILTENIMMYSIQRLLDRISENNLECLCELITIIGSRLEVKKTPGQASPLDNYFKMFKDILVRKQQDVKISSRVKFMIQDVIDLRENNWIPRIQTKTGQIETKTNSKRKNVRLAKYNRSSDSKGASRGGGLKDNQSVDSKRGDRGGINSRERIPQKIKYKKDKIPITSETLPPFRSENSDVVPSVSTQSTSILERSSRSGSIGNNKTSFSTESNNKTKQSVKNNNRRRYDSKHYSATPGTRSSNLPRNTAVPGDIDEDSPKYLWAMVRELYNASLATNQTSTNRIFAGQIVCNWINQKLITVDDNLHALKEFVASVLDSDHALIWVYIAEFITPAIKQNFLSLRQIRGVCNDEYVMEQVLQHLIPYLMMEYGSQFVRNLFKECEWSDLISAVNVSKFIREHKFEFVKDSTVIVRQTATGSANIDLIQTRVKEFLNDCADLNVIQEFIAVNLAEPSPEFVRALTTAVIEFVIDDKTFKFSEKQYSAGLTLLTSYIGDNIDLQLQCLNAIQILLNKVAYPKEAIQMIFTRLYDDQVVFKDVFHMWRDSTEILDGKSEALSNWSNFFELIDKEDISEEKM